MKIEAAGFRYENSPRTDQAGYSSLPNKERVIKSPPFDALEAIRAKLSHYYPKYTSCVLDPAQTELAGIERELREKLLIPDDLKFAQRTVRKLSNELISIIDVAHMLSIDRLYMEHLSLDGPQSAGFCPHITYLYPLKPANLESPTLVLQKYMSNFLEIIARPLLIDMHNIEESCIADAADWIASSHSSRTADLWSDNIKAISRCRRFLSYRMESQGNPKLFFQYGD